LRKPRKYLLISLIYHIQKPDPDFSEHTKSGFYGLLRRRKESFSVKKSLPVAEKFLSLILYAT